MFYVYLLKSQKDNNLYIGSTNNLKRRFEEHNKGFVHSTKSRLPLDLIYFEAYKSESDAHKREQNLKLRSNAYRQLKLRIKDSFNKSTYLTPGYSKSGDKGVAVNKMRG